MKSFSIFLLFLILCSCNEKIDSSFISYENNKSLCSKILINGRYKENKQSFYPFSPEMVFATTNVTNFENVLANSERTGYCCCPATNLQISFYNRNNYFDHYLVDTLEFQDKIRIYQTSFQFSYLVDKREWGKFLSSAKKLNCKLYKTSNLNDARKIYNQCQKNSLLIETANTVSKYWMKFDGDFILNIDEKDVKITFEDVVKSLKEKYPNREFLIESLYEMHKHNDDKSKYFHSNIKLKIYCNKKFYDLFNDYKTKLDFKRTGAEFYVLGENEKLSKLPNI